MIHSLKLKKTAETTVSTRSEGFAGSVLRRIWSAGAPASFWAYVGKTQASASTSGHLHATTWRTTLSGLFRCSSRHPLGIFCSPQTLDGGSPGSEAHAGKIPAFSDHLFDPRQLLSPSQTRNPSMGQSQQSRSGLDADKCFLAQQDRVSVHGTQKIRYR